MNLEDFKGKEGFNQTRNEECINHNQTVVARYKKLYLDAQPDNIWPVKASLGNPLWDEYPLIPPSTSPKIDNPNTYFPISEFKIGIQDFFPRKK